VSTPKLSLTGNKPAEVTALAVDTLVVGTIQGPDGPSLAPGTEAVDDALDGRLLDLLVTLGATGKADEVVKLPTLGKLAATVVLAAGLGKPGAGGAINAEQVRRASGAAARAMTGVKRAGTVLSTIDLGAAGLTRGRSTIRFLLAASFHRFEYGLKARIISQRCETWVAPEVRDAFVAAGDGELQPFDRLGVITLQGIKIRCRRSYRPSQPCELQRAPSSMACRASSRLPSAARRIAHACRHV